MRIRLVFCLLLIALPAVAQKPPQANQVVTRIAFGSCAYQERPQPVWEAIRRYHPELFIFAGDNVYGDVFEGKPVTDSDRLMDTLRQAYAKADTIESLARLRRTTPHLATWDDHDYGRNDAGGDFPHRAASQQQFADFWKLPADDPRRSRPGVYHAEAFGPPGKRIQVILLDTRSFRSPWKRTDIPGTKGREVYMPDVSPDKTMLGAEQWLWLEARLKEPADLRLVVSSIQVLAEGHGWERWGNLPHERQRLFDLISSTNAGRVIFLSGDRHLGALYKREQPGAYPLHEITSSGLTQYFSHASETEPLRIGALYGAVNFGTFDIDWWAGSVTVSLRSLNGESVRRIEVPLAEISFSR